MNKFKLSLRRNLLRRRNFRSAERNGDAHKFHFTPYPPTVRCVSFIIYIFVGRKAMELIMKKILCTLLAICMMATVCFGQENPAMGEDDFPVLSPEEFEALPEIISYDMYEENGQADPVIVRFTDEEKQAIMERNRAKIEHMIEMERDADDDGGVVPPNFTGESEQQIIKEENVIEQNGVTGGFNKTSESGRISKAPMVDSGDAHTVWLREDGTVWTWGLYHLSGWGIYAAIDHYYSPVQVEGLESIVAVSAGGYHSLALKSDGTVWAWGGNGFSELGDGTYIDRQVPVQVIGLDSVIAISAGGIISMALKSDGTVWVWGSDPVVYYNFPPTQVTELDEQIISISAGCYHCLALSNNGTVYIWVPGDYLPIKVAGESGVDYLSDVVDISAGNNYSLALKSDGTVFAWGFNDFGQLGIGTATSYNPTPAQVLGEGGNGYLTGVVAISASSCHSMALKNDGSVWAWGSNWSGNLGDGTNTNKYTPVQVISGGVIGISTGYSHSVALKNDGSVYTVGDNSYGQIGNGTSSVRETPVQVLNANNIKKVEGKSNVAMALAYDGSVWEWDIYSIPKKLSFGGVEISNVKDISVGFSHTILLMQDGTIYTYGSNTHGQLGDGTTTSQDNPVQVKGVNGEGFFTDIVSVAAGENYSLAVKADGTVYAWGRNNYGQLGDGTTTSSATPVRVKGVGGEDVLEGVKAVYTSHIVTTSVALKEDGTVFTWGFNGDSYALGNSYFSGNFSSLPTQVRGVGGNGYLTDIVSVSAKSAPIFALKSDGNVYGWGSRHDQAYGRYSIAFDGNPIQVGELEYNMFLDDVISISSFGYHVGTAVRSDGSVWYWGLIYHGNFGVMSYQVPEELTDIQDAASVFSYGDYKLIVKNDGTVWSWGHDGPFGDGNFAYETEWYRAATPTSSIAKVYTSEGSNARMMVLNSDGTVWGSGTNDKGALGDGGNEDRLTPVQALQGNEPIRDVVSLSLGNDHTLALKSDGTVWAWGYNNAGRLGDGTGVNSNTAVQVADSAGTGYLTDVVAIAAGWHHSVALKNDGTVWAWGYNPVGQLGEGNQHSAYQKPVQVKNEDGTGFLTDVKAIAAAGNHTAALKNDGTILAWGQNTHGQLGNNTTTDSGVPVHIQTAGGTITGVKSISLGLGNIMALKADSTVWMCGLNDKGQLGNNTTTNSSVMVQVLNEDATGYLTDVSAIECGRQHCLAMQSDGTVLGWGYNMYRQLATGYNDDKRLPTRVLGVGGQGYLGDIVQLSAGYFFSAALTSQGRVRGWGYNIAGEFGIGSSGNTAHYPTAVFTSGIIYDDYHGDFDRATEVETHRNIYGTINFPDDVDCFKYTALLTGNIDIHTSGNIDVTMYDEGLSLMQKGDMGYSVTSESVYYIKVTGNLEGNYTFSVGQSLNALQILNPVFKLGATGNNVIIRMQTGFVRSSALYKNNTDSDKNAVLIILLRDKQTNGLENIATLNKSIQAGAAEAFEAGFNIPTDYENYKIEIMAWDENMELISNEIVFQ